MDENFPAYRGSPFIEPPLIEVALYLMKITTCIIRNPILVIYTKGNQCIEYYRYVLSFKLRNQELPSDVLLLYIVS